MKLNYWTSPSFYYEGSTASDNDNRLIDKVCKLYHIERKEILSKTRKREVTDARFIVLYLLHKIVGYTQEKSANILNKSHCTVIHGCKEVSNIMDIDLQFRAKVINLENFVRYVYKIEVFDLVKSNASMYKGVTWHKVHGRWQSRYGQKYLGEFKSEYRAHLAREKYIKTIKHN